MIIGWPSVLCRPWLHISLLCLVGLQAFFANIGLSLFAETEGLYAMVTHTMMGAGDFLHLWLRDEPYLNKPPLFFWIQAGFVKGFGWSEAALRFPSAAASLGTLFITYACGRLLFSHTAAFWSAMAVGTCYAGLWFGPLAIIDPVLTFFMTLGMYAWARAYFMPGSSWWYAVGFLALTFGTMVKTFHALALPLLVFAAFLGMRRDRGPLRNPWFWLGLLASGIFLGGYYGMLGQEFWEHFFFKENLQRMVAQVGDEKHSALEAYWGKRPIHWYAYAIWFDLFPWVALLPVGLILVYQSGFREDSPRALYVLLWAVGYFVAFSLVPEKHERYLLPMLPAMSLVVGYVFDRIMTRSALDEPSGLLRFLTGSAGAAFFVLAFLGPYLLQKKWFVPLDIIPFPVQIGLGVLGLLVLWLAFRGNLRAGISGIGLLALALMLTVTECVIPGIHAEASPRRVFMETQQHLKNPADPVLAFQSYGWRGDEDEFYWDYLHGGSRVIGEGLPDSLALEELRKEIQAAGELAVLMSEEQFNRLVVPETSFKPEILLQFHRSKKRIVLVSLKKSDERA